MSVGQVVNGDTAYGPGMHEITLTPEGRLRIDSGASGTWDSATAVTPGTAFTPGDGFIFIATLAGTVNLTLLNGTVLNNFPVSLGLNTIPFTITNLALGTATGTGYVVS